MSEPTIVDAKALASKYRKRAVLIIGLGGASFGSSSYGMTREDCRRAARLLDQIGDRISTGDIDLDGVGMPKSISPCDCKHDRTLFVQSGQGGPPSVREHVTLCPDCGEFHVSKTIEGVRAETRFTLPTWELVIAAGQYARLLESGDK